MPSVRETRPASIDYDLLGRIVAEAPIMVPAPDGPRFHPYSSKLNAIKVWRAQVAEAEARDDLEGDEPVRDLDRNDSGPTVSEHRHSLLVCSLTGREYSVCPCPHHPHYRRQQLANINQDAAVHTRVVDNIPPSSVNITQWKTRNFAQGIIRWCIHYTIDPMTEPPIPASTSGIEVADIFINQAGEMKDVRVWVVGTDKNWVRAQVGALHPTLGNHTQRGYVLDFRGSPDKPTWVMCKTAMARRRADASV